MIRIRFAIAACAVVVALAAAAPATAATKLVATVGPGFTITLTKGGKKVTVLRAGRYTIAVRDRSTSHNFALTGPRLRRATGVAFVGTRTWNVRLRRGKHTFVCSPHATDMRGAFTVR